MVKRKCPVDSPSVVAKRAKLDPVRLANFRRAMRVETQVLSSLGGAAHIVLHRGQKAFTCSGGLANRERGTKFGLKTLCRLHGATKPLVAAAFLTLVDAGRCRLEDPVAKYLRFGEISPLSDKRAFSRNARRKATLRDLLTMTAGLGYESPGYRTVLGRLRRGKIKELAGFVDALAETPLKAPPGTRYDYSFCHDVLGRICEVVSGHPLDKFMQTQLLGPLGMKDTHFVVPATKRHRAAELYEVVGVPPKALRKGPAPYKLRRYTHRHSAPGVMSGGGGILSYNDAGMWSTAADYARFCQMLLDDGLAAGGVRVLRAATARSLWTDALTPLGDRSGRLPGFHDTDGPARGGWWDYRGISLVHSFLDLEQLPRRGLARQSRSMWFSGGGGAYWTIDRAAKLVTVSFSQTFGGRPDESDGHGPFAYRVAPCL